MALSLRLTSTRSSCLVADSDSMPGSAAAIFLNRACCQTASGVRTAAGVQEACHQGNEVW